MKGTSTTQNTHDKLSNQIHKRTARTCFDSKRGALPSVRTVSFRCQENARKVCEFRTLSDEIYDRCGVFWSVDTKKQKKSQMLLSNASRILLKVRSCSLTTLLAHQRDELLAGGSRTLIANWWAVRQRRFHGTNESIKSRRKEQTIQNEREDRDRNRFQRGKNNSKRENDRSFIGISSSHNLNSEQFRKTNLNQTTFSLTLLVK